MKNNAEVFETKEERHERLRKSLLSCVYEGNIRTIQHKVASILNKFPFTRNSDIALQIKYWEEYENENYQPNTFTANDLKKLTKLTSITRARAKVQNSLGLFKASPEVQKKRGILSHEYKEESVNSVPNDLFTVYADESGKNGKNIIVGSIWLLESFTASISLTNKILGLRIEHGFNNEFHFTHINNNNLQVYKKLASLIAEDLSYVSFKAVSVENKGFKNINDVLAKLFYYLLRDGVEHENNTGRASLPRRLSFIKDPDEVGSDKLMLADIKEKLNNVNENRFDNGLFLSEFDTLDSKESIFIQISDLFTGSLNRLLNKEGTSRNQKDEFADYFLKQIGFSTSLDSSVEDEDMVVYFKM